MGTKIYETRHWHPNYLGPIAIHAAKRRNVGEINALLSDPVWQAALRHLVGVNPRTLSSRPIDIDDLPFGAIVSKGYLAKVIKTDLLTNLDFPDGRFDIFGDYSPGRFAWKIENLHRIEPIDCIGRQKFFSVDI